MTSPALGDAWGRLNRCLEIARELGEPVGISCWWQCAGARHDVTAKLREFMPLLLLEGKVVATAEMADRPRSARRRAIAKTGEKPVGRCILAGLRVEWS